MKAKTVFILLFFGIISAGCVTPTPNISINIYLPDCENLTLFQETVLSLSSQNIPSSSEIKWVVSQGEIRKNDSADNKMVIFVPTSSGSVDIEVIVILPDRSARTSEKKCFVVGATATPNIPTSTLASPAPSTPTIEVSPTPKPQDITPSSIPTETAAAQRPATSTPAPTSAPPTPTQASVLFSETFDNNQNGWTEQSRNQQGAPLIESTVTDGMYKNMISCPPNYPATFCGFYIPVPSVRAKDFHLEIDANVKVENAKVGIEIWFRKDGENRYTVAFYNQGFFNMLRMKKGENVVILAGGTDAPSMNRNDTEFVTNRLGLNVQDNVFQPIVNEQWYGPVTDPNKTYMGEGDFLIALYVSKGGNAWINLDNLIITNPQK